MYIVQLHKYELASIISVNLHQAPNSAGLPIYSILPKTQKATYLILHIVANAIQHLLCNACLS